MESSKIVKLLLTSDSQNKLLKAVPPTIARHIGKVYADHITLYACYTVVHEEALKLWEARRRALDLVVVCAFEECSDDKIQAVKVSWARQDITCENAIPHITISCAPNVKPAYSNTMLIKPTTIRTINIPLMAKLVIEDND